MMTLRCAALTPILGAALLASGCAGGDDTGTTDSAGSTSTTDSTTSTTATTTLSTSGGTETTGVSGVSESATGSTTTDGTATDSSTTAVDPTDTDSGGGVCGDGVVDADEGCDDGDNNGSYGYCLADCSAMGEYCGDGVVNGPEGCDDANDVDDDECSNACVPAGCGDGVVQGDEECDDANDDNADGCLNTCVNASCGDGFTQDGVEECDDANDVNTDACLDTCKAASCGDSIVQEGVEACDDGVNDGAYGGCAVDCAALADYCGDGVKNGPEACDDANDDIKDGCLGDCSAAKTCLVIYDYDNNATDGIYTVAPDGITPFDVHCDMTTDGGGYSFLKLNPNNSQFNAAQAEAECDKYGMNLFIPRSLEHKNSAWAIANNANIGPDANANYMRILGIYPKQNGATCVNQPMNSGNANCGWKAKDDKAWYVHAVNNISEPNGDNNVAGSMYYSWQANGNIQWHNDIGGAGYTSERFMCDFGDKVP